eukprot:CAMPEP_0197001484 /NCGR_PEP_ID=MMETSP1380-20130617/6173_1 /TAXON_ID=5936 /ORGANISM="Euplotes crassus, Strain CT5" /LENGTH=403 /DNA_ID=CAMNT_0042419169 /DNA_START=157 /DNA_END=1369 /DNA_ORIENTATION=+
MGYLHIECMKYWLNTKKTTKEYNRGDLVIHTWKIVSCELCKQPYPHIVHFRDQSMPILEYEEPKDEPFIILESYPKEGSRNETQKSIYICKTGNKRTLNIGRAQQNELRIHDISISRNHAEISIVDDTKLYIKDVKSKFGTLVLVKAPEIIPEDKTTVSTYQIGRTVFIFNNPGKEARKSIGKALCAKFASNKNKTETLKPSEAKPTTKMPKTKQRSFWSSKSRSCRNNESEFFLDDEFYDRLENDFQQKQNPPPIENDDIRLDVDGPSGNRTDDPDHQREPHEADQNQHVEHNEGSRHSEEDEEDEGMNPLAQTHDGKALRKLMLRDRAEIGHHQTDGLQEGSSDRAPEEEKRMSISISNDNLEITLNQNAPPGLSRRVDNTIVVPRKSLLDEEEKENKDHA